MMRGGDERRRSAVIGSDECSLPCSSAAWAEKAHLYWRGRGQLNAFAATNTPGLVRGGVSSRPGRRYWRNEPYPCSRKMRRQRPPIALGSACHGVADQRDHEPGGRPAKAGGQGIWRSERAPCPPIADGRRTECDLRPRFSCHRENTSGCPAPGRQARGAGPFSGRIPARQSSVPLMAPGCLPS
jgi:hypothetical protein